MLTIRFLQVLTKAFKKLSFKTKFTEYRTQDCPVLRVAGGVRFARHFADVDDEAADLTLVRSPNWRPARPPPPSSTQTRRRNRTSSSTPSSSCTLRTSLPSPSRLLKSRRRRKSSA